MVKPQSGVKVIVQLLLIFLILPLQACAATPMWKKGDPKHHTTEGFRNYPIVSAASALGLSFYWRRAKSSFSLPDVPENHFLTEEKAVTQLQSLNEKNSITWIGQSTLLIRIDGKVMLTDPFFSEIASPFPVGPGRFVDPGITPENLPPIDIILISHNHFDHLDETFIETVPNKENIHVFVPLKLGPFFVEHGYKNVHELDWHKTDSIFNIQLTALPTVHYSGRGLGDKNKTLWCSWAISSRYGKYFSSAILHTHPFYSRG